MNILVFSPKDLKNPEAGGAENVLFRLIRRLVEEKHSVTVITSRFAGSASEDEQNGARIIRTGSRHSIYISALLAFWKIRREKFDLIIEMMSLGLPFFTPLFARIPKMVLYFHVHQGVYFIQLPYEIGWLGYPAAALCWFIERVVTPFLYRSSTKVTFCQTTKVDLERLGHRVSTIIMLQEGIEIPYLNSTAKAEFPSIVVVGRLKKYKMVQDVINAMKRVTLSYPEARLSVIGRGDYQGSLELLAREAGVKNNVEFLGYVSEDDKIEHLQKAWVLVMPSSREGWATPVIEANSCGTPAIASEVVGVKETVAPGETGFVYPLGDADKLAEELLKILGSVSLRQQLSSRAREWAGRFSWEKTETDFVQICNQTGKRLN